MRKLIRVVAEISIIGIGLLAIVSVGYGLYQQSQLYPVVHQQIGFQQCVNEVNAQVAAQQANQIENAESKE